MQTHIHNDLKEVPAVNEAESILRACVHCGFCTAVCPTYQELGDDLDSPRGRIYLIKSMLEEDAITPQMNQHLDRCLTCRSCETTCPSGVQYGRLLDIGKDLVETRYAPGRPVWQKALRYGLRQFLTRPRLFETFYRLGQTFRVLLPASLKRKLPIDQKPTLPPAIVSAPAKRAIVLQGCVQRALTPGVNRAIEHLLARHQIAVDYLDAEGCCGAVNYHLGHHADGKAHMRRLLDLLDERLDQVEWIISSASGCGVTIKEYGHIFADEPIYRDKAHRVLEKVRDVSEVLATLTFDCQPVNIAVHTPCTLQHGQKLPLLVTEILKRAGATILPTAESHLCCGSAGTYSVLESDLATRLTKRKLKALTQHAPDIIVTANVGCQTQLAGYGETPVMHWAEFLLHHAAPASRPD